jgi:ribosomal protein L18E
MIATRTLITGTRSATDGNVYVVCDSGTSSGLYSPDEYWWWTEIDNAMDRLKEHLDYINLRKIENAIKATETMVLLGRIFRVAIKSIFFPTTMSARRMMFSKSGYLPKKIRALRKDR